MSKALIELRRRLGESQQSMANRLGCALQTVARWETRTEPQSVTLWRLWELARDHHYDDLREVFARALDKFKEADRRRAEEIEMAVKEWGDLQNALLDLAQEGMKLSEEGHPAGARITELVARAGGRATRLRWWTWRNR